MIVHLQQNLGLPDCIPEYNPLSSLHSGVFVLLRASIWEVEIIRLDIIRVSVHVHAIIMAIVATFEIE